MKHVWSGLAGLGLALAGLQACNGSAVGSVPSDPEETGGEGGQAGAAQAGSGGASGAAGTAGASGIEPGVLVWSETSEGIEVRAEGWGNTRFSATRSELSESQLARLEDMITRTATAGSCDPDQTEYFITIHDEDGTSVEYTSHHLNTRCGNPVVIAHSSFPEFWGLAGCLTAWDTNPDNSTLETAPTINSNDGCSHGVGTGGQVRETYFVLQVEDADAVYTIQTVECGNTETQLRVYDSSGETLLDEGEPSEADANCSVVEHTFAESGLYVLEIEQSPNWPGSLLEVRHEPSAES